MQTKSLNLEEAFQIIDQNSDGIVGLSDLRYFIANHLLNKDPVSEFNLTRLIKMFDRFNRNYIQKQDFFYFFKTKLGLIPTP